MHWVAKTLLAIVFLVGLLALSGAAYQTIGTRMDARRSPEPGKLVDIGGYRLKINCVGALSPTTVVLESGLGDVSPEWERVQAGIAKFSRVCSYDRAGYGGSDPGPTPRTSAVIATELHTLLQLAEKPPFVLVGHSFGGYTVRVFNGRYPSEVAGLVLVDSPQEDEYQLLPSAWKGFDAALLQHYERLARTAPFFVGLGIARLRLQINGGVRSNDYLILQSKYLKARASELENIQTSAEQARAAGGIGDKPLIVLTAGKSFEATPLPGLSLQDLANSERTWVEDLQPRLARLSTHGAQLVLRDSGHDIPSDRPDAVVEAVRQICTTLEEHY